MEDIDSWELKFELCDYSDRLLNKLLFLNASAEHQINIQEVKKAIYYARKYHGDQKRQSGEPYYSHPLEVAYNVSDYLFKTDAIVTSVLHDVLEDTNLTFAMIVEIFDLNIAEQVLDLTRVKRDRKITSAELVESLWLQKKYELLFIKQFDRLHNIETIGAKSPEKIKKILDETISNFIVLAAYLGIRGIEERLVRLCVDLVKQYFPGQEKDIFFKTDAELLSLVLQNDEEHK